MALAAAEAVKADEAAHRELKRAQAAYEKAEESARQTGEARRRAVSAFNQATKERV